MDSSKVVHIQEKLNALSEILENTLGYQGSFEIRQKIQKEVNFGDENWPDNVANILRSSGLLIYPKERRCNT